MRMLFSSLVGVPSGTVNVRELAIPKRIKKKKKAGRKWEDALSSC
jgi:hypothetical protein